MTEAFRSPAEVNYLVVALANARDNLSRSQATLADAQAAFAQQHTADIAAVIGLEHIDRAEGTIVKRQVAVTYMPPKGL